MRRDKTDSRVRWSYDGHSGEDDAIKATKKADRLQKGLQAKYVRGLLVCQDGAKTKFVDRDVNGSVNIAVIWLCDNTCRARPVAFDREAQEAKRAAANRSVVTPCNPKRVKLQVRGEKLIDEGETSGSQLSRSE
jgi:hypothetical protein